MSNILTYLTWRGDVPLTAMPVNEIDGLILSQLSMMHWEYGLGPGESATLEALLPSMSRQPVSVGFTAADDAKLMAQVAQSQRFGPVVVTDYTQLFDAEAEMQFAAVTLLLPDGSAFVSFRGTDATIVGWKEDFNMAYSKPVPAQLEAVKYLREAAERHPGILRVGGHSKGGNLAMYASAMVEDAVLERITDVYSNDGPGLSDQIDAERLYARIADRLHAYVPQSSIVGMVLAHPKTFEVVQSNSVSVLQHNPYSWQVEGPRFVRADGLAKDSVHFEAAFRKWLSEVDQKQRSLLVETLFNVLSATDAHSFGKDFWQGLSRNPAALVNAVKDIEPDTRREISRMMLELADAALHPGDKEE